MGDFNDWREWSTYYRAQIRGYEWNFSQDVLRKISGLDPNAVTPQREFIGPDGRKLHMDFAIELPHSKIAIELNGYDKTGTGLGETRQAFNSRHDREQSLTAQGWTLFSCSNAQFSGNPQKVIANLQQTILSSVKLPAELQTPDYSPTVTTKNRKFWVSVGVASAFLVIGLIIAIALGQSRTDTGSSSSGSNPGNSKDCSDFTYQEDAQDWFDRYFAEFGDVAKLDGDQDRRACNSLPTKN